MANSNPNLKKIPPEVAPKPTGFRLQQFSTSSLAVSNPTASNQGPPQRRFSASSGPLHNAKSTPSLNNMFSIQEDAKPDPNGNSAWKNSLDSLDTVSTVSSSSPRYSDHAGATVAFDQPLAKSSEKTNTNSTATTNGSNNNNNNNENSNATSNSVTNDANRANHTHSHSDSGLSSLSGRTSTMSPVSTMSTVSSVSSGSSSGSSRASLR